METSGLVSLRLHDELYKSIEAFGVDKTIELLYTNRVTKLKIDDENVKAVLLIVAQGFGLTIDEIINGKGRKNERVYAIGLCSFYLGVHFHYEPGKIATALNRERSVCWKYCKKIKDLSPGKSCDEDYLKIIQKCDVQMKHYLQTRSRVH